MKLGFAPRALRDLQDIGDFIAQDHPGRALTFVEELVEHCRGVAATPEAYPVLVELGPGVRRAVHKAYLIFFRVENGKVRVVRIIHGSRLIRFSDL